jgi:hypothetical protein
MHERRTKRSDDRDEALQYLVETVADRSEVRALVLLDESGHIVAGMGMPWDLVGLARLARPIARREPCVDMGDVTRSSDVTSRAFEVSGAKLYLAALGDRIRGLGAAMRSVERILS